MKPVRERNHIRPSRDFAGGLDRGLNSIGAGRSGKHRAIVHLPRKQDVALEGFQKTRLRFGMHVEPVRDTIGRNVLDQRALQFWMVVAVVQRRTAGQEVDVALPVIGHHLGA